MRKLKTLVKKLLRRSPKSESVQQVVFDDPSRTRPVSRLFGLDRGTPVDRYYIETFLAQNSNYIRGSVLEIAENTYSRKFGSGVTSYGILSYDNSSNNATITGDLTALPSPTPGEEIDCFICTQTLNFIFDVSKALQGCSRLLRKGGVLLCTVSGLSQISRYDMERWGDYWRFTNLSIQKLFEQVFNKENIEIKTYGNVLAAKLFLDGLAVEDIPDKSILDVQDPDYQIIIGVRAVK